MSDYEFDDDLVLDEEALAFIDKAEQSHFSSHPPKKQKTSETTWTARPARKYVNNYNDPYDLPDITVHPDGNYSLLTQPSVNKPRSANSTSINQSVSAGKNTNKAWPPNGASSTGSTSHTVQHQQDFRGTTSSISTHSDARTPPLRDAVRSQNGIPTSQEPPLATSGRATLEMSELQARIEEMKRENDQLLTSLQEATQVRRRREGELSILKKDIDKTAKEHDTQLAVLKKAKEEADANQSRIQREMRDEMERMKTQFIFKQHEIEASARKATMSARSKKVSREPPATPVAMPSNLRSWDQFPALSQRSRPNGPPESTPMRPSTQLRSPRKLKLATESPQEQKKPSVSLPRFQNAFTTDTPAQSNRASKKGKGVDSDFWNEGPSSQFSPFRPRFTSTFQEGREDLSTSPSKSIGVKAEFVDDIVDDVTFVPPHPETPSIYGVQTHEPEPVGIDEEFDEIPDFDWKAELVRLILTHSSASTPPEPTFKKLMSVELTDSSSDLSIVYSRACARMLDLLASSTTVNDRGSFFRSVSSCFITMVGTLNLSKTIAPLVLVLNLITHLIYSLPKFSSSLLRVADGMDAGVLVALRSVILDQLVPQNTMPNLGREVIAVLEALSWDLPIDDAEKMLYLTKQGEVLAILVDANHPRWLLCRSSRCLLWLSTVPQLVPSLVSPGVSDSASQQTQRLSPSVKHIEILSIFLTDTAKDDEMMELKDNVLALFGTLAKTSQEALGVILGSPTAIPSIISYLTQLATPLWEDDETFASLVPSASRTIRKLNQTLQLLHYLVVTTERGLNLRQKLQYAPHRLFNGIIHMFIVTLGRLSYADPPVWILEDGKNELEQLREMARDIFDLVVDGPEADAVWEAYQGISGRDEETDEEEMEAELLQDPDY